MTVKSNRADIAPIQLLRGIAALMVALFHVANQLRVDDGDAPTIEWLAGGVDVFFVISGFIMWVSVARHPERGAGEFIRNRLIRIVPLYWALTAVMLLLMLLAPHLLQSARFDAFHAVASFLFTPAAHPGLGAMWPIVVPGWTLNYEMFFYLLFAIAIAFSGYSAVRRFAWVAAFLLTMVAIGQIPGQSQPWRFYGDPILLEFLFGIGLGMLFMRERFAQSRMWWLVVIMGFVLLFALHPLPWPRFIEAGLPAALIVGGAMNAPGFAPRALVALGDASYSIYLSHVVTVSALVQGWRLVDDPLRHPLLFGAAAMTVLIAVGYATYIWIERPLTAAARRGLQPKSRGTLAD